MLEEDPFNTSSAAGPKPWPKVATTGAMARCQTQEELHALPKSGISSLPRASAGQLFTASDWQLEVDLRTPKVPKHIVQTRLHPDLCIYCEDTRQAIMLELTTEKHMEEAHNRKLAKYQDLLEDCSIANQLRWAARGLGCTDGG